MNRNDPHNHREGREANEGLQYRKKESRENYGQDEYIDDTTNSYRNNEDARPRKENYRNRYREEDKWNERDADIRANSRRNRNEDERYVNPYQVYKNEDDFPYQTQYENFETEYGRERLRELENRNKNRDPERLKVREDQVRTQYMDNRKNPDRPKGYRKSDDRIEEEVCNALMRDRNVNASLIDVRVNNGVVTLSGTVDSRSARFDAEMAVDSIRGVEDIQNNLKVRKWEEREDYRRH